MKPTGISLTRKDTEYKGRGLIINVLHFVWKASSLSWKLMGPTKPNRTHNISRWWSLNEYYQKNVEMLL